MKIKIIVQFERTLNILHANEDNNELIVKIHSSTALIVFSVCSSFSDPRKQVLIYLDFFTNVIHQFIASLHAIFEFVY